MITLTKTINKLPKNPLLKTNKGEHRFEMNIKTRTGNPQQTTPQAPYFLHFFPPPSRATRRRGSRAQAASTAQREGCPLRGAASTDVRGRSRATRRAPRLARHAPSEGLGFSAHARAHKGRREREICERPQPRGCGLAPLPRRFLRRACRRTWRARGAHAGARSRARLVARTPSARAHRLSRSTRVLPRTLLRQMLLVRAGGW